MRKELLDEYMNLYNCRRDTVKFQQTYTRLSELWMDFTDEERRVINRRFMINLMW